MGNCIVNPNMDLYNFIKIISPIDVIMERFYILMNENDRFLKDQLITYLGNKRKLLSFIEKAVSDIKRDTQKEKFSIFDGFSGSGIVGRFLKQYSDVLHVNDLELYSEVINRCYLSNREDVDINELKENITKLNKCDRKSGFITSLYSPKEEDEIKSGERAFYTPDNAMAIDSIRQHINKIPEEKRHFYLAPLLSEASIHANTSGVFKGFYKNNNGVGQFGGEAKNCLNRIKGSIKLPMPVFSNFSCEHYVHRSDVNTLVKEMDTMDITYYDPPYNQHPYGSNYFMLNVICQYKEPNDISKVSGIPKGWNKSGYNSKKTIIECFSDLIDNTKSKYIIISYNSEGFIKESTMMSLLRKFGKVKTYRQAYPTFRGSRNLRKRSKTVNEFLFVLEKKHTL